MFLLINKLPGPTSHDIINQLRRITGYRKIGHAGTLDPFATGLLIVAISRDSTKKLNTLLKLDKTYLATLQFGAASTTLDPTGQITPVKKVKITKEKINQTLKNFIGPQTQIPPAYSAKKISGLKAYQLARKNISPQLKPQAIHIYQIKLVKFSPKNQTLQIEVDCSSGTYLRTLAADIGAQLKTKSYLAELKRTAIGPFKLSQAINPDKLTPANWQKYIIKNLPPLPVKTKVILFGTFDRLHAGHLNFLNQAKKLGDELYVVVARDHNVKKIKSKLPRQNETIRLKAIQDAHLASSTMLGNSRMPHRYRIINKIKPDVIALGYDQHVNLSELKAKLKKYKLSPKIKRLKPYRPQQYKSSKM